MELCLHIGFMIKKATASLDEDCLEGPTPQLLLNDIDDLIRLQSGLSADFLQIFEAVASAADSIPSPCDSK